MRTLVLFDLGALSVAACSKEDDARQPTAGECPALTAQQFEERGLDLGSGSSLNGVGVRRQRGSSACRVQGAAISCEMSDPGVVGVTPAEGAQPAYFDIPQGRNASITVSGGQARCTLS